MVKGKCAVCNADAQQLCASCRNVYYCGREHQKEDWKRRHKTECGSYKIVENSVLGRHVVATRDIKAGEVIIKEPPLALGPKVACTPICLGCHKSLKPTSPDDETPLDYYYCSGCGWPVCSPRCETTQLHARECQLMKDRGYRSTITYNGSIRHESAYCTVLPMRCFLLESTKLKKLLELESHLETRLKTPMYQVLKKNLVGFVRIILGFEQFDEETIMKVAGILDTNSFEIRRTLGNIKIRGMYPKVAMLSHDCKPNTKHFFEGNEFTITVSATVDIKKDEIISTTYTQTLWGTQARRNHISRSKCFQCACNRCSDPSEFGLYVGGILCSKCNGMMTSLDPLTDSSKWKCSKCSHTISSRQITAGYEALTQELDTSRHQAIAGLEKFISKYCSKGSVLHSTNTHVLQAKHALSQLYGNSLQTLTDKQLQEQISICENLLEVADKLEPGLTRFRGVLLYDLQAAKFVETKRKFENDLLTESEAQEVIAELMSILGESSLILQSEPDLAHLLEEKVKELSEFCQ